ncbi:uncharacterized protein BT62DRAFT_1013853 [Guyanagaster necrorhizus]|uniref:Uncharacterized protein n=1 Tax=Guyanagaster necrorhizus TaxID=856835 RepID=A0A9P7VF89_9AGAR|nr:uncharacterized protein BT62DRAFT_1013853 [Guyanagaster necrorhizus MCA 3950]KAG7439478.1 hypothetical protein BT62DRAFT_1013853 [Guyanagaster necrorhizus MCA 3950]
MASSTVTRLYNCALTLLGKNKRCYSWVAAHTTALLLASIVPLPFSRPLGIVNLAYQYTPASFHMAQSAVEDVTSTPLSLIPFPWLAVFETTMNSGLDRTTSYHFVPPLLIVPYRYLSNIGASTMLESTKNLVLQNYMQRQTLAHRSLTGFLLERKCKEMKTRLKSRFPIQMYSDHPSPPFQPRAFIFGVWALTHILRYLPRPCPDAQCTTASSTVTPLSAGPHTWWGDKRLFICSSLISLISLSPAPPFLRLELLTGALSVPSSLLPVVLALIITIQISSYQTLYRFPNRKSLPCFYSRNVIGLVKTSPLRRAVRTAFSLAPKGERKPILNHATRTLIIHPDQRSDVYLSVLTASVILYLHIARFFMPLRLGLIIGYYLYLRVNNDDDLPRDVAASDPFIHLPLRTLKRVVITINETASDQRRDDDSFDAVYIGGLLCGDHGLKSDSEKRHLEVTRIIRSCPIQRSTPAVRTLYFSALNFYVLSHITTGKHKVYTVYITNLPALDIPLLRYASRTSSPTFIIPGSCLLEDSHAGFETAQLHSCQSLPSVLGA